MEFTTLLVKVEDRVATVTINRPEVSNAFATETYGEIAVAMQELGERTDVGAIIITGAGKNFSAGGDIKRFKMLIDTKEYLKADGVADAGKMPYNIRICKKPTIAMINGVATGAGLSCAVACDFRAVQPSSKMAMAFINMGIGGDTGGIHNLVRLIGPEKTMKMAMLGDPVPGEECYRMGLASILAEEGKLEEETYAFAKKLAAKSDYGHFVQKQLVNLVAYNHLADSLRMEGDYMQEASRRPDFAEAVNAFLEKRKPEFNKGL